MTILTYVDECIIAGPSMQNINHFVKSIKNGDDHSVLTDEGDINRFLGIELPKLMTKDSKSLSHV